MVRCSDGINGVMTGLSIIAGARDVHDGEDVERNVMPATHNDLLGVMLHRRPRAIGLLVLETRVRAARVLDAHILNVTAEVGEAPRDVRVATDDDPWQTGQCEADDVEWWRSAGSSREMECSLVPDVRHAKAEVHVVRDQRLSRTRSARRRQPSCSSRRGIRRTRL